MSHTHLFKPFKIGNFEVKHRIGMAPLTRLRATDDRVPTPMMKDYYSQRASVPGTLIITEGTFVSSGSGGFPNAPGIWNDDQIAAWEEITDEVHRQGSFIFCQLALMGRAAYPEVAASEGAPILAPSAIAMDDNAPVPRAMTMDEIKQSIDQFVEASKNAIRAGFDGVEIHAANGYLLDQFLQDNSNQRTDEYGGSVENRSHFVDEIVKKASEAIGAERVGLRLSPWSTFQGMRMKDPIPQFTDIIRRSSGIAYLHLVESRVSGSEDADGNDSLDFAYRIWDGPLLVAGGYTPKQAMKLVDETHPDKKIIVVFGRFFISNPDLVYKIAKDLDLVEYDRGTFYTNKSAVGYSDYPFGKEYSASVAA